MSDRDQLKEMLRRLSVRHGDFQLVSGQRSEWYVDAKLTTCTARGIPLVGKLFMEKLISRAWRPQAVGGLTMGADAIALAIARESPEHGQEIDAFVIRKEAKQHGMKKFVEGITSTAGVSVVILDDVCTTGGSTVIAIERAREAGMQVLGAICLVDREMGGEKRIQEDLDCPFDRIFRLSELV